MGLFKSFLGNVAKQNVGGEIAYYGLTDWWLNEFTAQERRLINATFKPMGRQRNLDEGNVSKSSASVVDFLGNLASWFKKAELYSIGKKILEEGERHYSNSKDVLDCHFFCHSAITVHYANRDGDPEAMERAIYFCKKQIALAPKAKKKFLSDPMWGTLPRHTGYTQLAVIYEKQKRFKEAISICEEALAAGWNTDDCTHRLERLKKKQK